MHTRTHTHIHTCIHLFTQLCRRCLHACPAGIAIIIISNKATASTLHHVTHTHTHSHNSIITIREGLPYLLFCLFLLFAFFVFFPMPILDFRSISIHSKATNRGTEEDALRIPLALSSSLPENGYKSGCIIITTLAV